MYNKHFQKLCVEKRKKMCKKIVSEIRNNNYNINNVRSAAELLLNEYKVKNNVEIPIPIVKIINDAGFSIFRQDLPTDMGGYIVISDDVEEKFGNDKIIVVNENEKVSRQRFSLAHEFGHFLLDPNAKNVAEYYDAFERDDNKTDLEKMIDRFAAELLIPADNFKRRYVAVKDKYIDNYDLFKDLACYFDVPPIAIQKRFLEVGIEL